MMFHVYSSALCVLVHCSVGIFRRPSAAKTLAGSSGDDQSASRFSGTMKLFPDLRLCICESMNKISLLVLFLYFLTCQNSFPTCLQVKVCGYMRRCLFQQKFKIPTRNELFEGVAADATHCLQSLLQKHT